MRDREFISKMQRKVKDVEYVPSEDAFGNIIKRGEKPIWYRISRKRNFVLGGLFFMVSATLVYNIMPQLSQNLDPKHLAVAELNTIHDADFTNAYSVEKPIVKNKLETVRPKNRNANFRKNDKPKLENFNEMAIGESQNSEKPIVTDIIDHHPTISRMDTPIEALDGVGLSRVSNEKNILKHVEIKPLGHPVIEIKGSQTRIRIAGQMGYAGALYRSKINNEPLKQALKVLNDNGFTQSFLTVGANYEYQGKGKNLAFYAGVSYDRLELDILKYQIESVVSSTNDPLFRSPGKLEDQAVVVSKTISLPIGLKWYPLENTKWKLGFSSGGFVSYNADNVNNLWKNQDDQISYLAIKSDFRTLNLGLTTGASLEYKINKLITVSIESQFGLNFWNTYKSSYLYRQNRYFGTSGLGLAFSL